MKIVQMFMFLRSWSNNGFLVYTQNFRHFLELALPELKKGHKQFNLYNKEIDIIIASANFNFNRA